MVNFRYGVSENRSYPAISFVQTECLDKISTFRDNVRVNKQIPSPLLGQYDAFGVRMYLHLYVSKMGVWVQFEGNRWNFLQMGIRGFSFFLCADVLLV